MRNVETQNNNAKTSEKSVKNSAKKKRGKPFKNSDLRDVYSSEFKKISRGQKRSASEKKLVKSIAETMLIQGFTVSEIAKTLSVPKSTVCLWKDKLSDETKAKTEQNVLNSVSSNLSQFLNSSIVSMSEMAIHCSQEEYLEKASLNDVVKFFDTLGNFAFNLIEANERFEIKRLLLSNPAQDEHD